MPLPRFAKLDPERQEQILEAARIEFAEHGFCAASYNRIIARADISKGAMYYYFADKDDLYRTVLQQAASEWLAHVSFQRPIATAAEFWDECEAMQRRQIDFLIRTPVAADLCWSMVRARFEGEDHPAIRELNAGLMSWLEKVIEFGQSLGAIRTDLPTDMLTALAFGLFEGMDRWLANHWPEIATNGAAGYAHMTVKLLRQIAAPEEELS